MPRAIRRIAEFRGAALMGGLCGVLDVGGVVVEGDVVGLCEGLSFRAWDGVGVWCGEGVGLGGLNGWVLPEDVGVLQPWVAVEGDVVVVGDVRLDDRAALVARLGCRADCSDVEVVGWAFRRWGVECFGRLLGDFAVAVWDRRGGRLVVARDVMGMRPLYWRWAGGRFVFGSEAEPVARFGGGGCVVDEGALAAFLCGPFGRLDGSFFAGVSQLAPGCVGVVDAGGLKIERFWSPDLSRRVRFGDEGEYAEALRELLVRAVGDRLRSVGPVGLMLSGGVDSGAIAATAGSGLVAGERAALHAFSFASELAPSIDERYVSDRLAAHAGIESSVVNVDDAVPMSRLELHPDDPNRMFFEESFVQTLRAARAAGSVALMSGDRGDTTIGSSGHSYLSLIRRRKWSLLAVALREHHRLTGEQVTRLVAAEVVVPGFSRARSLRGRTARDPRLGFDLLVSDVAKDLAEAYSTPAVVPECGAPFQRERWESLFSGVTFTVALQSERLAAREGLTFMDPWADRRILEFVLSIPEVVIDRPRRLEKRLAVAAIGPFLPNGLQFSTARLSELWSVGLERHGVGFVAPLREVSRSPINHLLEASRVPGAVHDFVEHGVVASVWSAALALRWCDPKVDLLCR